MRSVSLKNSRNVISLFRFDSSKRCNKISNRFFKLVDKRQDAGNVCDH